MASLDPAPFFAQYGNNAWAVFNAYLDAASSQTAAPVIAKYLGKLAAADVFTNDNAFVMFDSLRVDYGVLARSAITRRPGHSRTSHMPQKGFDQHAPIGLEPPHEQPPAPAAAARPPQSPALSRSGSSADPCSAASSTNTSGLRRSLIKDADEFWHPTGLPGPADHQHADLILH